jgi:hypothetical protein
MPKHLIVGLSLNQRAGERKGKGAAADRPPAVLVLARRSVPERHVIDHLPHMALFPQNGIKSAPIPQSKKPSTLLMGSTRLEPRNAPCVKP